MQSEVGAVQWNPYSKRLIRYLAPASASALLCYRDGPLFCEETETMKANRLDELLKISLRSACGIVLLIVLLLTLAWNYGIFPFGPFPFGGGNVEVKEVRIFFPE